jgi:nitrate/nitrite-specific signal transduction histidine kinase
VAERPAFIRKHYFIDPRLQGRYMLTFLIPMLIMLGFMVFTLAVASQSVTGSASKMLKEDIETMVGNALRDQTNPSPALYEELLASIGKHVRGFPDDTKYRKALMGTVMWAFGVGVLIVIVQLVLLTVYFSHKVAGPIYRLERVCSSVADGNYTESANLRRGDELQNLASLLNRLVQVSRERIIALRDEPDAAKRGEQTSGLRL